MMMMLTVRKQISFLSSISLIVCVDAKWDFCVVWWKKTNVCVCVCHKCRHRTLFFIIDDVPYVQSKFVNFFYSQYKLWTRILNSLINRLWSFCIMTNIDSITIDTWIIRFICIIFFLWFEKKIKTEASNFKIKDIRPTKKFLLVEILMMMMMIEHI